jgi:hypothetical protein
VESPSTPKGLSPRLKLLIAIGLGPATLVITPLVALVTLLPLLLLAKLAPNGLQALTRLVEIRDLNTALSLAFGLIAFLFLLGVGITAGLSWFLTRSWKHGLLTLVCAMMVQVVSCTAGLRSLQNYEAPQTASLGNPDSVFQTYGRLENLGVEIHKPYPDNWGNPNPEYGTAYQYARVLVRVRISRPGLYGVDAHYGFQIDQLSGSTPWKSEKKHLEPGLHVVPLEFRHNEVGPYAFWDTTFVGGTVMARLSYFASEKELLDAAGGDPGFEKYLREDNEGGTIGTTPDLERSIDTMERRIERNRSPMVVAPPVPREYLFPMGPSNAVDLVVARRDGDGSTTYRYSLTNRSRESLFSFMVGSVRSSSSCPDLRTAPVGYVENAADCPGGIVIRRKWRGSVSRREECDRYYLNFGYPDGDGLVPGGTLTFTVTVSAPDSTYEHAGFWVVGQRNQYEGKVRGSSDEP